mmetsp:Transcript_12733/g.36918  ORF Transcript_12733/g.36918 Transcript_12733/m.36918 type:complete len:204 (+) Transcript_12733:555-1166(+)
MIFPASTTWWAAIRSFSSRATSSSFSDRSWARRCFSASAQLRAASSDACLAWASSAMSFHLLVCLRCHAKTSSASSSAFSPSYRSLRVCLSPSCGAWAPRTSVRCSCRAVSRRKAECNCVSWPFTTSCNRSLSAAVDEVVSLSSEILDSRARIRAFPSATSRSRSLFRWLASANAAWAATADASATSTAAALPSSFRETKRLS